MDKRPADLSPEPFRHCPPIRPDDQALAEVTAALFYAAHDLLAAGMLEWQPRAARMLEAARSCSEVLEQRMNRLRPSH